MLTPTETRETPHIDLLWLPRLTVTLGALALYEGERAPWYMGPAWYLPYTDRMVFMPMPLNWLAAYARQLWIRAKKHEIRDELAGLYRYGHNKGFAAGDHHGYEKGLRHAFIVRGDEHAR